MINEKEADDCRALYVSQLKNKCHNVLTILAFQDIY